MNTMASPYPSKVFSDRAAAEGKSVYPLWTLAGPPNTAITWITAYSVDSHVALVLTYEEGGWDVFTGCKSLSIEATLADAMARL